MRKVSGALVLLALGLGHTEAQTTVPARVETRLDRHGDILPLGAFARLGTARLQHQSFGLVFSPGGKLLASAGRDGVVRLWDAASGKEMNRLAGHNGFAYCVALSPDNKLLASGDVSHVHLWEVASGRKLRSLVALDRGNKANTGRIIGIYGLAFLRDGKLLAASEGSDGIRLWEVATGKDLGRLEHRRPDRMVNLLAAATTLASATPDGTIRFWDAGKRRKLRTIKLKDGAGVIAISPDGSKLLVGNERYLYEKNGKFTGIEGKFFLWDVAADKEIRHWTVPHQVRTAAFSPDGRWLAFSHLGIIDIWDSAGKKLIRRIKHRAGQVSHTAFSPDGKTLASQGALSIQLWNLDTGTSLFSGHDGHVDSVAFSPDGKRLVSSCREDRTVRIWDLATGREQGLLWNDWNWLGDAVFASDGKTAVCSSSANTILVWECGSSEKAREYKRPGNDFVFAGNPFTLAGDKLISLSRDTASTMVVTSNMHSGKESNRKQLQYIPAPRGTFQAIFSSDGTLVGEISGEDVFIHEVGSGRTILHLRPETVEPGEFLTGPLVFTPDGRNLAAISTIVAEDHRARQPKVRLWEVATGSEVFAEKAPAESFPFFKSKEKNSSATVSPDGRVLAIANRQDFHDEPRAEGLPIRLWDLATGKEFAHYQDAVACATSLTFSPDGATLAAGMSNASVLLWDLKTARTALRARTRDPDGQQLDSLWKSLGDSKRGYSAIWSLADAGDRAVTLINDRLKPAAPVDSKHLARLIADLGSASFSARNKANLALEELADLAEPVLRRADISNLPLETKRRIEQLLNKVRGPVTAPVTVRDVRAIQVLEYIATPKAQAVLKALANGTPEARLTGEARKALPRLAKRLSSARVSGTAGANNATGK